MEVAESPLGAERLLGALSEAGWPRRVLIVANTVDRAQRLYEALRTRKHPYAVRLLHSRYLASDRKAIEEPALALFGRARPPEAAPDLLVATQVLEVGLDLSCDRMHTEVAPASSLVQRFGRCARWPGEEGVVVVHPPETDGTGRWRLGPYRDQDRAVRSTWDYLRVRPGLSMDAFAATDFVDAVHGEDDRREFAGLDLGAVEREVAAALDAGEIAMRRKLIRDADSVSVLALADGSDGPDPRRVAEWVSVPRPTLYSLVQRSVGSPVKMFDFDADGPPEWPGVWREEPLSIELIRSAALLVLPSSIAAYSADVGLRLGVGGSPMPVRERPESHRPRFGYQREPYLDHIARVVQAGQRLEVAEYTSPDDPQERRPGMAVALAMLDSRLGKPGTVALLCRLACVLHDVGKLSQPWQTWADVWERAVNLSHRPEPLAHTTFDPDRHGLLERRFRFEGPRRPPHAVASALACMPLVQNLVDELLPDLDDQRRTNVADAVLTAVGRHHAPRARQGEPFWPIVEAHDIVRRSLELVAFPASASRSLRLETVSQHRELSRIEDEVAVRLGQASDRGGARAAREAIALYWVIVRYLRTADGHSQALARVEEV